MATGLNATYPIYFDETEMLSPHSWSESSEVIETVNQTEAGTDQVDVTRFDKLSISVSYAVAESQSGGMWAQILKRFSKQNIIKVKRYDILKGEYETRNMRMRDFSANLKPKSDMLPSVNGVWEISFTLIQF